jgi:urease accessory protein
MRVGRPFVFTDLKSGLGVEQIARFIIAQGGLAKSAA